MAVGAGSLKDCRWERSHDGRLSPHLTTYTLEFTLLFLW